MSRWSKRCPSGTFHRITLTTPHRSWPASGAMILPPPSVWHAGRVRPQARCDPIVTEITLTDLRPILCP